MNFKISVQDKKEFLKDLLEHIQFKQNERMWIKRFLLNSRDSESILKKIHFVDDTEKLNNVIILTSSVFKNKVSIQLIADDVITTDINDISYIIRSSSPRKKFHLHIQSKRPLYRFSSYVKVVEDNKKASLPAEYSKLADDVIRSLTEELEIKHFTEEIDRALDNNDKKSFLDYTGKLKKIKK